MTYFAPSRFAFRDEDIFDLLGIGFGPSNISVAIAQREMAPELRCLYLEKRDSFGWHDSMLFDDATMQVSFLKDLASFRNPRSHFTFVNFLHSQARLADFSNLQTLFPRRVEFHQYLSWCADFFKDEVAYGSQATCIERVTHDGTPLFQVTVHDVDGERTVLARNIVHSGGLIPHIPFPAPETDRIFHGYHILNRTGSIPEGSHVAVAGAGQSAAEIVQYLLRQGARVTAILPRFGYMPADDSPFVNQVFDPDEADTFFDAQDRTRDKILQMHATTNYSGVDLDLVKEIYADWYQGRILGQSRLEFRRMCRIAGATVEGSSVTLQIADELAGATTALNVDYLVCATGFRPSSACAIMSSELQSQVTTGEDGTPLFARDYSLVTSLDADTAVYAPHMTERQHGLTATLLSRMAVRSGEIINSVREKAASHRRRFPRTEQVHAAG
ncbi:hypothetical protein AB838_22045 [Rhodobacteraceae bacterium (ex Bugula neritina AB1)]|nr:hypothetical protein AB838_22045 [Rhodobacteraceae bacterium (ex Bugula neritina AB1)]